MGTDRGFGQGSFVLKVVVFLVGFGSSLTESILQARPDLSIQDITALLVSLVNLSLSCYPDKIDYVDQVLEFAKRKVTEFSERYFKHFQYAKGLTVFTLCFLIVSKTITFLFLAKVQTSIAKPRQTISSIFFWLL